MTHVLSLGAINKQTREYIYPKIANKKDEYVCPDCNKDLILCQGGIIRPYFRHKVDSVNPCNHYSNPTETQIHKDGKMVMKSLLERKIPISFIRNCCSCKKNEEYEIPEMTESSKIELEYRFEYNGTKIADVAYLDNDDILCIFEICNTHKTCRENRPEPWFEIDAETLIKLANDSSSQIKIPCIRYEKCDDCIVKEREHELERKRKIRNAVEQKSCYEESDNFGGFSKPIMEMLINIICGDDAYEQWSSIYRQMSPRNFDEEGNPKEWGFENSNMEGDIKSGYCSGNKYIICYSTYYNEDLIRDIQNMKLYECLNSLNVWFGQPQIELEVGVLSDTEDKLNRLCKELFGCVEVSVTWVGDDHIDNDCCHCNGTGYFKGDKCWFC